ncbi:MULTISPECIES: anthranilate synthase component I [unclassified Roseitalea]|uniref:anthranilate synthase component I n=1 Tax=unclassified Roseitalea TaxID=2639107 RepID=UPI00273D4F4A|nr:MULTISPECIES: anthranilate synthase component I [unclassified Roseitalea]
MTTTGTDESAAERYTTRGGVAVRRGRRPADFATAIDAAMTALDDRVGAVLSSNYEYPGRYRRWDTAIVDPPVMIAARKRAMTISALNGRGAPLVAMIADALDGHAHIAERVRREDALDIAIAEPSRIVAEEDRSRAPSVFSVLRTIVEHFSSPEDADLALFGAFGYDLAFQFDPVAERLPRDPGQRDLVLFFPDEILVVDNHAARAWVDCYDFDHAGRTTRGIAREPVAAPFRPTDRDPPPGDHAPGEYAKVVEKAREKFARGDLFEVVPGRMFHERVTTAPSAIARRLKQTNPAPYSFFMNLGDNEFLVGASPEMFVRVTGRRIETCPISGTIARGADAMADSEQILKLLNSKKDESELTMCSDVDRNDKSRVCEPGSVRVIGRRQIEMYSRLIHTVDHVDGRLREDMDAFDGFLSHAWAVTVTGAPKLWAMRFIEANEKSQRAWYGGAIGMVKFNGDMNTGLTLRTIHIRDGIASVRAGATLLFDSDPEAEEEETELKASAMLAAIREAGRLDAAAAVATRGRPGEGLRILLVDHEDSFVHTLANYFRQTGAEVRTVRSPVADAAFDDYRPGLIVLSPGPGWPSDFDCKATIRRARDRDLPVFGVCLGLQALTEAYGGTLRQLNYPMHGKPSRIRVHEPGSVFAELPREIVVGRYHSVFADPVRLPEGFVVTAETEDGLVMGIEHRTEPVTAVQFHPESIMTLGGDAGLKMIENVVRAAQGR